MNGGFVRRAGALHEAVVAVRIVLDDGRRRPALQIGLQPPEHVVAGEVVLAGADHMHRAGDVRRQRHDVLVLARQRRRLDRRIIRHAGRDALVARGEQQAVTSAETETGRRDLRQRQLARHQIEPPRHLTQRRGVGQRRKPRRALLAGFGRRLSGKRLPDHGRKAGLGQRMRIGLGVLIDAVHRRQQQDAGPRVARAARDRRRARRA